MIRFSKILLYITLTILVLWQLPWCIDFFTSKETRIPFTLYSSLKEDFISITHDEAKGGIIGTDQQGQIYSQHEIDSLLPFFYMRQLVSDDRVPDTVNGVKIMPHMVQRTNFNYKSNPSDLNAKKPALYPLMESMSGRVDLEMPDDVFRITDKGIEFITISSNSIDEKKSGRFTKKMVEKGFTFPARQISGNQTTKKDYDEGYLILDKEGKLFQLKMAVGTPYVRQIELPENIELKNVFITEFRDRKTLGFLVDTENKFYVLVNKTYDLYNTGIAFNPVEEGLVIFGNMLDWTVCVTTDEGCDIYALDAYDYTQIKQMKIEMESNTPFGLHFTSYKDKYIKPRF